MYRRLLVAALIVPLTVPGWLTLLHGRGRPLRTAEVEDALVVDAVAPSSALHVCALCVFAKSLRVGLSCSIDTVAPPLRSTNPPRADGLGPSVRFAFSVASRSPPAL